MGVDLAGLVAGVFIAEKVGIFKARLLSGDPSRSAKGGYGTCAVPVVPVR